MNHLEEVRNKIDNTCILKYGVKSYTKTEEFKNKIKKTCTFKYGVDNTMKCDYLRDKCKRANNKSTLIRWEKKFLTLNNYILRDSYKGVFLTDDNYRYITWKKYLFEHKICGTSFIGYFSRGGIRCPKCYPSNKSMPENEMKYYIMSKGLEVEQGRRDLCKGYELDLYLLKLNIGFEYNGWYWHQEEGTSEIYNFRGLKPCGYHNDKTESFRKAGIEIYHLWGNRTQDNLGDLKKEVDVILGGY